MQELNKSLKRYFFLLQKLEKCRQNHNNKAKVLGWNNRGGNQQLTHCRAQAALIYCTINKSVIFWVYLFVRSPFLALHFKATASKCNVCAGCFAAFCASAVIYNVSGHTSIAMSRKLTFSATIYYIYTKKWRLESLIILNSPWRDLHISVLWHFCFMRHRWKHGNKRKKTPGYSSSGKPPCLLSLLTETEIDFQVRAGGRRRWGGTKGKKKHQLRWNANPF